MSEDLLAAYDEHLRGVGLPAQGASIERDGPLVRVVGEHRGFITRGHDLPSDLPDRLQAAGFAAEPTETVMIGRITDMPAAPPVPDGVVIRRVGGEAIPAIVAMESQVWGQDCAFIGEHLAGSRPPTPAVPSWNVSPSPPSPQQPPTSGPRRPDLYEGSGRPACWHSLTGSGRRRTRRR